MTIPLLDLVAQFESIRDEVLPAISDVLARAQFILGEEVDLFEEKFATYCDANHCVGVSSGTEALHLSLRALDIGPGDEVITAANSFAATAFAIQYTGATPVFIDINPDDYNLDVNLLEAALSSRTKAIMPVHLFGQPADLAPIISFARKHGLKVIEDASQAHGARYRGRAVGSFGDAGCFSFYPGKNLGAYGDGGAVVTNDSALAERLRLLRNYGQKVKNTHSTLGYNARLDTVQAAVLLVKLNHLDDWTERRRLLADRYRDLLSSNNVGVPSEHPHVRHVYHLFVIQHEKRDELIAALKDQDIHCGIHYPNPLPEAAPFRSARTVPHGTPVCKTASQRIVSLPIYSELTDEQLQTVAAAVNAFSNAHVPR